MTYTFIAEHCSDLPVAVCCRVMGVSTSGFYQRRAQPVTDTKLAEAWAANTVRDIWTMSRRSYGSPRVRLELRLGMGRSCSKTQAERWMRDCGAVGIHYPARRGKNGCTRRDGTDPNPDLVNRSFDPEGPDRLWVMETDFPEHLSTAAALAGLGPYAVTFALCGFDFGDTTFESDQWILGRRNGGWWASGSGDVRGGCATLVHERVWHGNGWFAY